MLKKFNLIVSTYRKRENSCISELWYFLKKLGDPGIKASKTGLPGLITAYTKLDPFNVVNELREIALERPWEFKYILKVVPIEYVIESDLEKIRSLILEKIDEKISIEETYKILPRIRRSNLSREKVIGEIAPHINRKVNLSNPNKIILIEIIEDVAGISILKEEQLLSIQKIRLRRL